MKLGILQTNNSTNWRQRSWRAIIHFYGLLCFQRPLSTQRQWSILKCRRGGGRAHLSLSHAHTPSQISQNALCIICWHKQTSLQSSQCQVCLQSICDNPTVGSCCSCPASWCFLGSSWVIWGHTIFRFDVADATGNVALTPIWGGGGGERDCAPGYFCFGGLRPPAQDTYLWVFCTLRISSFISLVSLFLCWCERGVWNHTYVVRSASNSAGRLWAKLSHLRTSWKVMQERTFAPQSFAARSHILSRLTLVAINGELARRVLSWQYSLAIRLPSLSEHMYVRVKVFECFWIPAAWNQRIYGIITPVSPFSSHWLSVFYYYTTHSSQANPWTFVKLPNTCKIWSFRCWYWF